MAGIRSNRVPLAAKVWLKKAQRWEAFLEARVAVAQEKGTHAGVQTWPTLERMFPDGYPWEHCGEVPRPRNRAQVSQVPDSIFREKAATKELPLSAFGGKSASMRKAVEWVFDHLDMGGVRPADAPSPGAWALREWAAKNKQRFYADFASKLIPSRSTLEVEERRRDSGDDVMRTIEYLLAIRDAEEAAGE